MNRSTTPNINTTFDTLIADLTRDAHRAQPRDALQFCADWFNARLQEQRARIRDIFEQSPQLSRQSRGHSAPEGLFRDSTTGRVSRLGSEVHRASSTSMPQVVPPPQKLPALGPFDEVPPNSTFALPPHVSPKPNMMSNARRPSAPSPFGTLNVAGNALNGTRTNGGQRGGGGPFSIIREEENDDGSDASPLPNPLHATAAGPLGGGSNGFLGPPPSALGRRVSVSGESLSPSTSGQARPPPFFPKTPEQMKSLEDAISDAFLFRKLDNKKRNAVLGAMKEVRFEKDEPVIVQGDDGDYFYVVDSGTLDCFKRFDDDPQSTAGGAPSSSTATADWHPKYGKKVTQYGRGGTFGELALMYYAKRAATVLPTSPCTLWALDRVTFQTILLDINAATRRSYEGFLASVPLLESLNDAERAKLADVLQPKEFGDGEVVVREGEVGREFYILEEGQAEALKKMRNAQGGLEDQVVKSYSRGDYFGELALLHRAPRAATVRAVVKPGQPKLKVAALDADAFTRLLGPLRDLMERSASQMYQTQTRS